jgi:phage terminase small subunit
MNQQQLDFVNHYIANGLKNATRSAIAAGYSPKIAKVRACKLKKHPEIRSAIADRQAVLASEFGIDRTALVIKLLEAYYSAGSTNEEIAALREIGTLLGFYDRPDDS